MVSVRTAVHQQAVVAVRGTGLIAQADDAARAGAVVDVLPDCEVGAALDGVSAVGGQAELQGGELPTGVAEFLHLHGCQTKQGSLHIDGGRRCREAREVECAGVDVVAARVARGGPGQRVG